MTKINKKHRISYNKYLSSLEKEQKDKLSKFFGELNNRLLVTSRQKRLLIKDFERAFVKYSELGISLDKAIKLIDPSKLGGFYSRSGDLWLPLDDVAKSYTQFVSQSSMAVFRVSAYLKDRALPEILQMALNIVIHRFPYFAMSVKIGAFWHYLDSTRVRYGIEMDRALPVQRIHLSLSGSKAFKVLFYDNRISVEFFHCLTDGSGAMEFLKTLVLTYLRLLGKEIPESTLIIEPDSIIDKEEYSNAYLNIKENRKASGYINKKALQMSGSLSLEKPCRVLHFKMPTNQLINASHKYNGNVTSYLTSVLTIACKNSIDQISGDISIALPVNMRKCYPSKTLRNFSLYASIRNDISNVQNIEELVGIIHQQMKDKTQKDKMLEMMASTKGLMSSIRFLPLPLKEIGTKVLYKFLGDRIFTSTLSNLGNVTLPEEMKTEVLSMDFVLGTTDINRAISSCVSTNGVTSLSITKLTKDPSYEETIYELLTKDGISIEVEGSGYYGN